MSKEECEQPNWQEIIKLCNKKIEDKYTEYGNSWVGFFDDDFWDIRLKGEVEELSKLNSWQHEEKIKELVDIINICAMQITNHKVRIHKEYWDEVVATRLGVG